MSGFRGPFPGFLAFRGGTFEDDPFMFSKEDPENPLKGPPFREASMAGKRRLNSRQATFIVAWAKIFA